MSHISRGTDGFTATSIPTLTKLSMFAVFIQADHTYTRTCNGLLPPATKLGQGYVFTRVCDSVHGEGGCLLPGAGWWRPPPRRLLLRAVRILLECILVFILLLHNRTIAILKQRKCMQLIQRTCWNFERNVQSLV